MFQVVQFFGKTSSDKHLSVVDWYELHAVAAPSPMYSGSSRMVIHWHGD